MKVEMPFSKECQKLIVSYIHVLFFYQLVYILFIENVADFCIPEIQKTYHVI